MHAGKKPGKKTTAVKNPEYDKLKAQLAKYVEEEEYEKAAEIQEKIRKMEKEGK
jgi:protein-arginine kinase activator protein McsA